MSPDELTDEVISRLAETPNERLREVMTSLVRHIHAFAKEVKLSEEEWMQGIQFLTRTGEITDEVRQEFILLSDTLGLSSLVDMINHGSELQEVTESTILGPFYVPDSPSREFGESMVEFDDGGEPAILSGRVMDAEGSPVGGAELDVWQNAANGFYAVQQKEIQPSTNVRGRYFTNQLGEYEIKTVRPVPYPIPADGPVGMLLRDTGRHEWRAAHVHIKVSAPGLTPVTTHIFDSASEYLESDTVFGVKGSLIEPFELEEDGVLHCRHDFILR
jgi:protocatechuate 3,4-dioxygenase beta subunit